MLKLKLQYFGHVMERANSLGKDPDAGKDWRLKEKGAPEDEMVGWHHQLNGHESEQTPGDSEGQGSLVCCSPWGCSQTQLRNWMTTRLTKEIELSFTSWHSTVHCWVFPGFLPCLHDPFPTFYMVPLLSLSVWKWFFWFICSNKEHFACRWNQ